MRGSWQQSKASRPTSFLESVFYENGRLFVKREILPTSKKFSLTLNKVMVVHMLNEAFFFLNLEAILTQIDCISSSAHCSRLAFAQGCFGNDEKTTGVSKSQQTLQISRNCNQVVFTGQATQTQS